VAGARRVQPDRAPVDGDGDVPGDEARDEEGAEIVIFTRHAYERYRQFHMLDQPTATDEDAREILQRFGPMAIKTQAKTHLGDPIWRIEALGVELVAKNEAGIVTCVTVLPPVRFRGITPLQAEFVEASLRDTERRVADLEHERAELRAQTPKIGTKPADLKAHAVRCQRLADLNPLAKIRQAEQLTLAAVLKTMRTQLSQDRRLADRQIALRIAVRYLRSARDPGAHDVLAEIAAIDPGLASQAFVHGGDS
jgi:hypothetical protein